ncbi:hypothetical protein [Raoultibacter phocaeensis]|uniref:hypothetical protein n=1 Tax=Raoultibacter phocaeensis TaxID=2479841 RepID=UPI0011192DAE|nr:hypothetical protein [Raoultibacter phocaeensis]
MKNALIALAALGAAFLIGTKLTGNNPKEVASDIASSASSAVEGAKEKATKAASHTKKKASEVVFDAKGIAHDAGNAVAETAAKAAAN